MGYKNRCSETETDVSDPESVLELKEDPQRDLTLHRTVDSTNTLLRFLTIIIWYQVSCY